MKERDARLADQALDAIVGGGLRKCGPRAVDSTERATTERVSKDELETLLRDAGLGGPMQGRETARILKCNEKTLRRWRDPLCGKDLAPPDIRIILQGRALEARRVSRAS